MRLENVIVHVNLNLEAFGDHQEFIIDWLSDELGLDNDFYFEMLKNYLEKHVVDGVELLEDRTYYKSIFTFGLDSFECYTNLEKTIERFISVIERKYLITSFNSFYHKVRNRRLKFETGSERDYFQSKAFNLFVSNFIKF